VNTFLKTAVALVASALFCFAVAQNSSAAETNVTVGAGFTDTFSPSTVSISVNDSVIWNWAATFHSSTSGTNGVPGDDNGVPSGLWDTGVIFSTPFSFTNTFTSPGVFSYYCSVHFSFGMTGQVMVASSATAPPSLAITNPSNGTVLAAPANVSIEAGVTNGSAAVTNVQFLVNNNLLANETSAPFSASTILLTPGTYMLSAIAQDNNGLAATNTISINLVTPATVSLTASSRPSGNEFQFSYSADVGLSYVVQRSTDLLNWIPLATNKAANNPVVFDDSNATNSLGFYRVGRLPNP
jgi:plastocyanin